MRPGRESDGWWNGFACGVAAGVVAVIVLALINGPKAHASAVPDVQPLVFDMPRGEDGFPLPLDGERWSHADVVWALDGAPLMVRRIVYCEVGRSGTYNPWAIGGMQEVGPAQLLPGQGNGLSIFYRFGYTDPNSPWQARAWIEEVIGRGMLGSQYPRTSLGCLGSP